MCLKTHKSSHDCTYIRLSIFVEYRFACFFFFCLLITNIKFYQTRLLISWLLIVETTNITMYGRACRTSFVRFGLTADVFNANARNIVLVQRCVPSCVIVRSRLPFLSIQLDRFCGQSVS